MRVTQSMIFDGTVANLNGSLVALSKTSEHVSSGKRLNRPSDDPADVRSDVQLNDTLAELNQYLRNIDDATSTTSAMDTTLSNVGNVIQRANELAIQGANSTLDVGQRADIAEEVDQLIQQVAQDAGAKVGDRFVFSGFKVDTAPYRINPDGTVSAYQGDHGAIIARVGPNSTMQINLAGDAVFQPAIDALTQLSTDLKSGGLVQQSTLGQIASALQTVTAAQANVGARTNRLDQAKASQESLVASSTILKSQLEDIDMTSAITELTKRQTTYQATLAVTAKVMQTSLIDYLR